MRVKEDPRPPRIDGTDPYVAPEEALMTTVGEPADVFSLGVTLYEMLTGKLPFPGGKCGGVCPRSAVRRNACPLPPEDLRGLEDIVMRCLDREPTRRPAIKKLLPALHDRRRGPLHVACPVQSWLQRAGDRGALSHRGLIPSGSA